MGFNLCNTSLISVRCGNGGSLDNPRAARLLTTFLATAAAGTYVLWKGALGETTDKQSTANLTEPAGIISLVVGAVLLAGAVGLLAWSLKKLFAVM